MISGDRFFFPFGLFMPVSASAVALCACVGALTPVAVPWIVCLPGQVLIGVPGVPACCGLASFLAPVYPLPLVCFLSAALLHAASLAVAVVRLGLGLPSSLSSVVPPRGCRLETRHNALFS